MTLKLAIFDVDGTLVDSQNAIVTQMARAFGAEGLTPPNRAEALATVGLSVPEAMRILAPRTSDSVRARLVDGYKSAYFELHKSVNAAQSSPLFDGAADVLRSLAADDDVLLAVATGKSKRGLDRLLAAHGLDGMFVSEQTADFHPSKPHPSMIEACLGDAGVAPIQAVMIGDTEFDIDMGKAADVRTIAVTWGYHPRDRLSHADVVVEAIGDIPEAVRNIWSDQP